ncbi:hypothetical protein [Methylobrevis albus]|uniref:Uncharacterized protein n=1 Tax=Methylobrevis albus TaxID=2793297 RepID=A0A931I0Q5_9HYPH|nr:hypothetical protein [Methylobrevis albus]MBH0237121.1 hypothetical protein [Methylobrevis albus]
MPSFYHAKADHPLTSAATTRGWGFDLFRWLTGAKADHRISALSGKARKAAIADASEKSSPAAPRGANLFQAAGINGMDQPHQLGREYDH